MTLTATEPVQQRPLRAGFWSSLGALLTGTLLALIPLGALAVGFHLIHVLPLGPPTDGGVGWPWRITGVWSALSDIVPRLVLSLVLANSIEWCLGNSPGVGPYQRWPLVLCGLVFSWPVGSRSDLLGVSGGVGFVAMWIITNQVSGMPRRTWRPDRRLLAAAGVVFVALVAVSVIYGALNPVAAEVEDTPVMVTNGASDPIGIDVFDRGPLPIRVLSLSTAASAGQPCGFCAGWFQFGSIEQQTKNVASSIDGLYQPAASLHISPGKDSTVWAIVHGPRGCSGYTQLSAISVRYRVDGMTKTADIKLPSPVTIRCQTR